MAAVATRQRTVRLHGHELSYRESGAGDEVVVALHGIAGSAATWDPVLPLLAGGARVVVPDLLGHGESAKPRGDYSLGTHASGVRDLLSLLGHDRVTLIGHSLGGGIALQFAYQFPERCRRLVLVASGGLGRDVSAVLRAAALPGAELVLPVMAHRRLRDLGASAGRRLSRLRLPVAPKLREMLRGYASLADAEARAAFIATLRMVVDPRGQRVDAGDRLYLAAGLPTLLVWGRRDAIIPVRHAERAHAALPGSRLEVFDRAGHYPHCAEPERFASLVLDFLATTQPATLTTATLRSKLVERARAGLDRPR